MSAPSRYPLGNGRPPSPPDYGRVVLALTDAELEDEILGGRGENDYRLALVGEQERRARQGPPPEQKGGTT